MKGWKAVAIIAAMALTLSCGYDGTEDVADNLNKQEFAAFTWVDCAFYTEILSIVENCWNGSQSWREAYCDQYACNEDDCPTKGTCGTGGYYRSLVTGSGCQDAWNLICYCKCQRLIYTP